MTTRRRRQFVVGQLCWQLGTVIALSLVGALSLDLFFVVSMIGFLVVVEVTAPVEITPAWRRRLRWLVLLGLVAFGYVLVRRVLGILPEGVV